MICDVPAVYTEATDTLLLFVKSASFSILIENSPGMAETEFDRYPSTPSIDTADTR